MTSGSRLYLNLVELRAVDSRLTHQSKYEMTDEY